MTTTPSLAVQVWSSDSKHPATAVIARLSAITPAYGLAHKDERTARTGSRA